MVKHQREGIMECLSMRKEKRKMRSEVGVRLRVGSKSVLLSVNCLGKVV